jgi:hypothetical protein
MNSEHKAAVISLMIVCMAMVAVTYIVTDHIVKRETQLVRALEVTEMLESTRNRDRR